MPPGDTRRFYETTYHFDHDVVAPGTGRLWRAMRLLEPIAGTTFLDLGSGVGWAAQLAEERGRARRAFGLDFAFKALALGSAAAPGVPRIQGDGTRLPLRDGSIDRVFSFGSIEHFPDVAAGLAEVRRVLAPAGAAVLVVPNVFVRTEQPDELRLSYLGWRRRFTSAGLTVVKTRADSGPPVLRDHRPARIVLRAAAKVSSLVPGLQYQFSFLLQAGPRLD